MNVNVPAPIIRIIEEDYEIPQMGKRRRISALLPADYEDTDIEYPVLYLHDGQNLFDENAPYGNWAIDHALRNLFKEGFGNIIIIAIDHGGEERLSEYFPYQNSRIGDGQGKLYLQFLFETLKPYVDKKFRVLHDAQNTGIGGSSMGGLISLYAGMSYPEVFGKMMIFSPSLWIAPPIYQLAARYKPAVPSSLYIYAGEKESQNHIANVMRLQETFKKNVSPEMSHLRFHLSVNPEGTHSESFWRDEFPHAVKWLYF
jgi:predicted alpha/beta superfamily hydrolase